MGFLIQRIVLVFLIYFDVISSPVSSQQCQRRDRSFTGKKHYAMYVWTNGFDHGVKDCDLSKFLEWDTKGPCFTHVWDTESKRNWLWATCNRAGREIDTIFVSGIHNILQVAYDNGDCSTDDVATVKAMLTEGHTKVSNLKIYGLFADSDIEVSEKGRVKYIVYYNDVCAANPTERFDGVATNNEAYGPIKCGDINARLDYISKLKQIVTEADEQVNGKLLTHYSVGWHWGICNGKADSMTLDRKNADFNHHMIDIFDSIDVQVGSISFPAVSERMGTAGYHYAKSLNKPFFATLYTNLATPCQVTFFPDDTCEVQGHSETAMFDIIDQFSESSISYARPCIHYFRGVYSAGVHPDWPLHDG